MKRIIAAALLTVFGAVVVVPSLWAHSGGTNKNGCHQDHKNDGRHCH